MNRYFFRVDVDVTKETDGRWIADVDDYPGCIVYGDSVEEAIYKALRLAADIIQDRINNPSSPGKGDPP